MLCSLTYEYTVIFGIRVCIQAATSLGDMYMYGDGVQKDLSVGYSVVETASHASMLIFVLQEAFKWFHKACNMGSPIAMFKLGQAYELVNLALMRSFTQLTRWLD